MARRKSAECYIADNFVIKPNSVRIITLTVPKVLRGVMPPSVGIVSADEAFIKRNDVHPTLQAAVTIDSKGKFKLPIMNTLDTEITVTKGQRFGNFTQQVFKKIKRVMKPLDWSDEKVISEFNLNKANALKSKEDIMKVVKFIKQFGRLQMLE